MIFDIVILIVCLKFLLICYCYFKREIRCIVGKNKYSCVIMKFLIGSLNNKIIKLYKIIFGLFIILILV